MGRNVNFVDKKIHKPRECLAYGQKCHKCKKKNHWASCCMTEKVHKVSPKSDDDFVIETVETALKEKSTEALAILKFNIEKVKKSWTLAQRFPYRKYYIRSIISVYFKYTLFILQILEVQ